MTPLLSLKTSKIHTKFSFREELFPFRGNWNLIWVSHRYVTSLFSALTLSKAFNAVLALGEMMAGKTFVRSAPVVLRIEPTNICNLRCPRCSCGIGTDPREKGFMDLADYKRVIEENKKTALLVRLDGNGEPLLHPEIFEMIRFAKTSGYSVSLSTNLNTLPTVEVEKFPESGLDRLIVSVDGATQASYEKYRIDGSLEIVEENLIKLLKAKDKFKSRKPYVEIQFLNWGYNHDEIQLVKQKTSAWKANRFQVISPDWAVENATANKDKPKRCFWLWGVLTLDWQMNYHSCTNAWTYSWPGFNRNELTAKSFWNHALMAEARKFNLNKSSTVIKNDKSCHCSKCSDMLVINRPAGYVCE
jgi:organic radical activating enzyme